MKELRQKKSKRNACRWMALCAVCMLFWAAGISVWAARTGNVRVNDVNVRTEAGSESNRVCKLPINTTVQIIDQTEGSDGKVWYSVSFTLDGAEKAGWIRSDMLTVSEEETPEASEGETSAGGSIEGYTIQEPEEAYEASDALTQTSIFVGEESFTAWQVDTERTGGRELYLVYAAKSDGDSGWFYYDPSEETFQREMGQFSGSGEEEPEGLIQALQKELTELKETSAMQLQIRLYIIIGLGALSVILLVLALIFGLKYRNAAYEYYDEDEDGDEPEEDEEDRGEDDFDDFYEAARRRQQIKEEDLADMKEEEPEEEAGEASMDELPEIDMSAVLEIEEEQKEEQQEEQAVEQEESSDAEDETDDFDIEILDWEDLGL